MNKGFIISLALIGTVSTGTKNYIVRTGNVHLRAEESITYDTSDGNRWFTDAIGTNFKTGDKMTLVFDDNGTKYVEDDVLILALDNTTRTFQLG